MPVDFVWYQTHGKTAFGNGPFKEENNRSEKRTVSHTMAGNSRTRKFSGPFSAIQDLCHTGLNCDEIMFELHVETSERLNLLNDEVNRYYYVIGNLTASMAKRYVCNACGKGCRRNVAHTCDQSCRSYLTNPSCVATGVRKPVRQTFSEPNLFRQP